MGKNLNVNVPIVWMKMMGPEPIQQEIKVSSLGPSKVCSRRGCGDINRTLFDFDWSSQVNFQYMSCHIYLLDTGKSLKKCYIGLLDATTSIPNAAPISVGLVSAPR